jgi:hypothetical protein
MQYIDCCLQALAAWMAMNIIADMCTWPGRGVTVAHASYVFRWHEFVEVCSPPWRIILASLTRKDHTGGIYASEVPTFCEEQPRRKSGFKKI